MVGRKDPLHYLSERYGWVDEEVVRHRLNSHLIPVEQLANGGYEGVEGDARLSKVRVDFAVFLEARARLVHYAMTRLAAGQHISAAEVFGSATLSLNSVDPKPASISSE